MAASLRLSPSPRPSVNVCWARAVRKGARLACRPDQAFRIGVEDDVAGSTGGETVERERRRARRARLGDLGRQTQMPQEALNHRGIFDQGDQPQTPTTPRAVEHIKAEAPAHQIRPERAGPVWSIRSCDRRIR